MQKLEKTVMMGKMVMDMETLDIIEEESDYIIEAKFPIPNPEVKVYTSLTPYQRSRDRDTSGFGTANRPAYGTDPFDSDDYDSVDRFGELSSRERRKNSSPDLYGGRKAKRFKEAGDKRPERSALSPGIYLLSKEYCMMNVMQAKSFKKNILIKSDREEKISTRE